MQAVRGNDVKVSAATAAMVPGVATATPLWPSARSCRDLVKEPSLYSSAGTAGQPVTCRYHTDEVEEHGLKAPPRGPCKSCYVRFSTTRAGIFARLGNSRLWADLKQ
jgi:hypothetical protein